MTRPTSQKTVVSRLFSQSRLPIYLLDASRRIIFCNEALAAWTRQTSDALLGLRCSHAIPTSAPLGELANQLSAPPQAVNEQACHASITIKVDKTPSRRYASFYLLGQDVSTSSTLVIVDSREADEAVEDAFDAVSLHQQLISVRESWNATFRLDQLIGQSPAMQQVRRQVRLATRDRCQVVIVGNPGSGRETVARTIHRERTGERASLVPLACSVLDSELIEVALQSFQYEREELSREPSTLLLLDVDRLPIDAQAILVKFLADSEVEVESIATTQAPLCQLSEEHLFRRDLAYRLVSLEIHVPPLCDRLEDVPLLAQWFLEKSNRTNAKQLGGFTAEAMDALLRYRWPGEVRELNELVHEARESSTGTLIDVTNLPRKLSFAADADAMPANPEEIMPLDDFLVEVESELILRSLRQAKGNKAQAARLLDISRGKLLRRIEQLGLEP